MKSKKLLIYLLPFLFVLGCQQLDNEPHEEEPRLRKTRLGDEPKLGEMISTLRSNERSTKSLEDGEEIFDLVNWENLTYYEDREAEEYIYTATFKNNEANYTDNLVISGSSTSPNSYIVRYQPESGTFDGSISNFTGTIYMIDLKGTTFGTTKLKDGKSEASNRGSANDDCHVIQIEIVENDPNCPEDFGYCSTVTNAEMEICGVGSGSNPDGGGSTTTNTGSQGGGTPAGKDKKILPLIDDDPCDTKDEILDNIDIQEALDKLWKASKADGLMKDRLEQGGWVVKDSNGVLSFQGLGEGWTVLPCGLNPPANLLNTIPVGAKAFVHTHPFKEGENRRSICGEDVPESYVSGYSIDDLDFIVEVSNKLKDFTFKGYVLDGNNITQFSALQRNKYNRCGY